jgi:hypothetical protein
MGVAAHRSIELGHPIELADVLSPRSAVFTTATTATEVSS